MSNLEKKLKKEMERYIRSLFLKTPKLPNIPIREDDIVFGCNKIDTLEAAGFNLKKIREISQDKVMIQKDLQKEVEKTLKLIKIKKTYEGNTVVTKHIIKKMCLNYNLKFSKVEKYSSHLDDGVSKAIEGFCKEYSYDVATTIFYIMAPEEMFKTNDKKQEKIPKNEKLALFAKVKEKEADDVFILIHEWGSNLSSRRFSGLLNSNKFIIGLTCLCIGIGILAAILGTIGAIISMWINPWETFTVIMIIVSAIWLIICLSLTFSNSTTMEIISYKSNWELQ